MTETGRSRTSSWMNGAPVVRRAGRHADQCRYAADHRWGLDVEGCERCRFVKERNAPRPGTPPTPMSAGRCRECDGPLSEARIALGLTLCSGRCHAAVRGQQCGTRPDHLWQVTGGEGWRCLYCSRITDDVALVRAGRQASDDAPPADDRQAPDVASGQTP